MFKKYPDKKYIIIGDYKNEVLEKYLEAFGGTTCISVKAQGQGTSAGLHQALEHIPAGKRFMFVWSDLILGEEVNIDETRGNVIGISRDFECRWSYKDGNFLKSRQCSTELPGFSYSQTRRYWHRRLNQVNS